MAVAADAADADAGARIDRLADQSLSTALRHAQSRAEADFGEEAASPPDE